MIRSDVTASRRYQSLSSVAQRSQCDHAIPKSPNLQTSQHPKLSAPTRQPEILQSLTFRNELSGSAPCRSIPWIPMCNEPVLMVTHGRRCASTTVSGERWESRRQQSSADLRAPDHHARLGTAVRTRCARRSVSLRHRRSLRDIEDGRWSQEMGALDLTPRSLTAESGERGRGIV